MKMNFLKLLSQYIKPLRIFYQDEDISKINKFHLDNIELGRNFLSFKLFLPIPKEEESKWNKNKNIAVLKIMIIVDGELIIKKNCKDKNTCDELEVYSIELEKLDKKYYKINLISNDGTYIYIESSSISGIFNLELVEDWFAEKILLISKF